MTSSLCDVIVIALRRHRHRSVTSSGARCACDGDLRRDGEAPVDHGVSRPPRYIAAGWVETKEGIDGRLWLSEAIGGDQGMLCAICGTVIPAVAATDTAMGLLC